MQKRKKLVLPESGLSGPEGLYGLFYSNSRAIVLNNNLAINGAFEWMAAFGKKAEFKSSRDNSVAQNESLWNDFSDFLDQQKDQAFGHFSYDLKNSIEKLHSSHFSGMEFPLLHFFVPEVVIVRTKENISGNAVNEIAEQKFLNSLKSTEKNEIATSEINLNARTSREAYLNNVSSILEHIQRGDIYEMNYCIEFYAEKVQIDPVAVFKKLNQLTEAPFSVLYRNEEQWLLCASPERFIKKTGSKLFSQPIKGTRPRGKNPEDDERMKNELRNDPKEQSENVMIVDLVRNDLSRSAKKGSVKVEELFGIHTFKNVHQMISTVSAELNETIHPVQAIKNAFPMGSMTGAPKVKAMELAEKFENMQRGLYSGAVGYFTPEMDFDFNVVIRSIQYNSLTGYLSLMVGSAITAKSDPEKEYEECLVKAKTLFQALGVEMNNR